MTANEHRHPAQREAGRQGGRKTQEALARLHSAGVAKSRRTASLPGAGGRHLPLWGGVPSALYDLGDCDATVEARRALGKADAVDAARERVRGGGK